MSEEFDMSVFTPELTAQADKDVESGMAAVTQSLNDPNVQIAKTTSPEVAAWADKTYVNGVAQNKVLPAHAETWQVILPHAQELTGLGSSDVESYKRFAQAADTDDEELYKATEANFGEEQKRFKARIAQFDDTPSADAINMMAPALQLMPAIKEIVEKSYVGRTVGGAVGLGVGIAETAAFPGLAMAIPADTLAGMGLGTVAGAFDAAATMHRGRMYAEFRRNGASHADAKEASTLASLALGAADATGLRYVLGSGRAVQAATQAGEGVIKAAFTQYLKNVGVNAGTAAYQNYVEQATKATVGMMRGNGKLIPTPEQIVDRLIKDVGAAAVMAGTLGAFPLVHGLTKNGKPPGQNVLDTMDDVSAQKPLPDQPAGTGATPPQGTVTKNVGVSLTALEQARFDAAQRKDMIDYEVESLPEGAPIPDELKARREAVNKEFKDARAALAKAQTEAKFAKAQAAFSDSGTSVMREALTGETIMQVVDSIPADMPLVQKHMLINKAVKEITKRFATDRDNWRANRKLLADVIRKRVPKEFQGEFLNDIAKVDSADSVFTLMNKGFAKKVNRLIDKAHRAEATQYMDAVLDKTKAAKVAKRDKSTVDLEHQPVLSTYEQFVRNPELAEAHLELPPGAPDAVYNSPGGKLPRSVADAIAGEVVEWDQLPPEKIVELADKIDDIRKAGVDAKHQEIAARQAQLREESAVINDGIQGTKNKKGEYKRPTTTKDTVQTGVTGLVNWWKQAWRIFGVWNGTWEFQVRTMLQHTGDLTHKAYKLLDITEAETNAADAKNKFVNDWKDEVYRYEDGRTNKKGEIIRDPSIGDAIVSGTKRRQQGSFTNSEGKQQRLDASDMEAVQAHLWQQDRSLWSSLHHGNKFTWSKKTLEGRVEEVAHDMRVVEDAIDARKLRKLKHNDLDNKLKALENESAAYEAQLELHDKNPEMLSTEDLIAKRFGEVPALQRISDGSAKFYKQFYKYLNAMHIKEYGFPLKENTKYGGQAVYIGEGTQTDINMMDMLNGNVFAMRSVASGSTKSRVVNTEPLRLISVVANTKSHIGRGTHWVNFADVARRFNHYFTDKKNVNAIENTFIGLSPEGTTFMDHINRAYKDFTGLERPNNLPIDFVEGITNSLGTMGPGGNPVAQFFKQATGWAGYAAHIDAGDVGAGMADILKNPKVVQERMRNSAFWRSRGDNAFSEFASVNGTTDIQSFREGVTLNALVDPDFHAYNLKQGLTAGTRKADLLNIAFGTWNGAYLKELKRNGGNAKEASLWADKVSNETQSSALPSAKSNFSREGSIPKSIEQFSTQSRQTFGKFAASVKEFGANPNLKNAHKVAAATIASSLTQGMFTWASLGAGTATMWAVYAMTGDEKAKQKAINMEHDRAIATVQAFSMGASAQGNPFGVGLNAVATNATNFATNSKNKSFMPSSSTLESMNALTSLGSKTAEMAIGPEKPELRNVFEWFGLYLRSFGLFPGTPSWAGGKGVPLDDLNSTLKVLSTKPKDMEDHKKRKGNFKKSYWMK